MNEALDIDAEALAEEVARYLAAVDVFRAANSEPTWLPERSTIALDPVVPETSRAGVERNVH